MSLDTSLPFYQSVLLSKSVVVLASLSMELQQLGCNCHEWEVSVLVVAVDGFVRSGLCTRVKIQNSVMGATLAHQYCTVLYIKSKAHKSKITGGIVP